MFLIELPDFSELSFRLCNRLVTDLCGSQSADPALHKSASQRDQQAPERTGLFTSTSISFRTGELIFLQESYLSQELLNTFRFFTQRQQRIQKDRLMNEFSAALNNFQGVQRRAAERERESMARARAGSRFVVWSSRQNKPSSVFYCYSTIPKSVFLYASIFCLCFW